uniref:transposase zinc-binding domain-containing protein n=1 Tax=Paenibacillus marchantiophytorum TaxID=1619310 RepID=UPI0016682FC6
MLKLIRKFPDCGDSKKGIKLLGCEGFHDLKVVPFWCKGCFCMMCSCAETEEWSPGLV